jgi:hypothetical protein
MIRRSALVWMRTLLPLLVLRLLLPTGLMLAPGEHGVALVLCSMQTPRDAGAMDMSTMHMDMDMDMSAPMDMSGHSPPDPSQPDQGSAHKDTVCPFAAAASPAPVSVQPLIVQRLVPVVTVALLRAEPQRTAQSGPLRSQISRAPPAFS